MGVGTGHPGFGASPSKGTIQIMENIPFEFAVPAEFAGDVGESQILRSDGDPVVSALADVLARGTRHHRCTIVREFMEINIFQFDPIGSREHNAHGIAQEACLGVGGGLSHDHDVFQLHVLGVLSANNIQTGLIRVGDEHILKEDIPGLLDLGPDSNFPSVEVLVHSLDGLIDREGIL